MARNVAHFSVPPERVFAVLSDPQSYGYWVVGSSKIRHADADWPKPGTAFGHTQGVYGVGVKDSTEVVAAERPRTLVLEARFRPFAINKVEMRMAPSGNGTKVVMVEYPTGGPAAKLHNPLSDLVLKLRNVESLRRLRKLAENGRTR